MRLLWISLVVFVFLNESVSPAVVIRRRPISIHVRASHTTAAATTTTTTTTAEPEIYKKQEEEEEEEEEEQEEEIVDNRLSHMTLPSNATSIRSDITDNFSCSGRSYGYYADIENDCQIFHVCLPVTYPDGREQQFRWSFICPEETAFDQEAFTCVRADEMTSDCSESERFYELNRILGMKEEVNTEEVTTNEISENFKLNLNVNNQRFRVTPSSTINPVRFTSQEGLFRNPAYRQPTVAIESNSILENTEKNIPLYTRFPERINSDVSIYETTAFASHDDQTTLKRDITTSNFDNFDFTTTTTIANLNANENSEYTATKIGMNTRIVPDLLEMNENANSDIKATDEIVDTIKNLQNIFPSAADDSRTKRFLFKADSVKNRQKLF